jgi:hypothetical protein
MERADAGAERGGCGGGMTARDTSTLRQVSLAALLGIDAHVLLATDDAATHAVYDKIIEQARTWSIDRQHIEARNIAVAVINELNEALAGRRR